MNKLFLIFSLLLLGVCTVRPDNLAGQSAADSLLALATAIEVPEARLAELDSACARVLRYEEMGLDTLFATSSRLGEELYGPLANVDRAIIAAKYFTLQGNDGRALTVLKPYHALRDDIEEQKTKATLLATYGNLLTNAFAYEPGIEVLEELMALYEDEYVASPAAWGRAHIDLGKNLFSIGRYGEASIHLNRAKASYREANDSVGMKFSHNELGNLYGRIALYDEAIRQFRDMERYNSPLKAFLTSSDLLLISSLR